MTDKQADTAVPIHELLSRRWSTRAFDPKPLCREEIHALLEAARWAPSSYNLQPWRFVVCDRYADTGAFDAVFETLVESNRKWVESVPVLIGVFADTLDQRGGENRGALYDVGAAAFSLSLQAHALGLSAHQLGGFDRECLRGLLNVPQRYEVVALIAVGHRQMDGALSPELQTRESAPRSRLPVSEIAFAARWNGHIGE